MAYTTTNGDNIGTRLVSVRIRRDLLEYIEMQQLNRNQLINDALCAAISIHQLEGCVGECKFAPDGSFNCFYRHD